MTKKILILLLSCCLFLCSCSALEHLQHGFETTLNDASSESVPEADPWVDDESSEDFPEDSEVPEDPVIPETPATSLNEEFYPLYASLDTDAKVVYEEVLKCIENGETEVYPSRQISTSVMDRMATYLWYDQPQIFWYIGVLNYSYDGDNLVTSIRPQYNALADNLEQNRQAVEAKVQSLLDEVSDRSDEDAELFFHDYLCSTIVYEHGDNDQNIYSAFIEGKTVCSGYTHALQYLMLRRGVPCYYCAGDSYNSTLESWEAHAWNVIKLDGHYYNCDVTWDDFYNEPDKYPSYVGYYYYNVPDKRMNRDHTRNDYGDLIPSCSKKDKTYKARFGEDWEQSVRQQLDTDSTYLIESLQDYYDFCRSYLTSAGVGSYDVTFLVTDMDVIDQMMNLSNDDWRYGYVQPAADYLGMNGWNYSYNFTYWNLCGNSSAYVEQHMELSYY